MKNTILTIGIVALTLSACKPLEQAPLANGEVIDETPLNAPQRAYNEANIRMHAGMNIINEDADIAFIQGMIPHHQGAVDMANIILEYGDDAEAQELARNIITAQEEEIAWMRNWLKERGLEEVKVPDNGNDTVNHSAMGH